MRMLRVDPGKHRDGADQEGWFSNQAESKEVNSLELAGTELVELKENHAATREIMSFMTYTSNNRDRIARGLPLEICFKVISSGVNIITKLNVPLGPFSVRLSDSGSYREVHAYLYLQLHLEVRTEER